MYIILVVKLYFLSAIKYQGLVDSRKVFLFYFRFMHKPLTIWNYSYARSSGKYVSYANLCLRMIKKNRKAHFCLPFLSLVGSSRFSARRSLTAEGYFGKRVFIARVRYRMRAISHACHIARVSYRTLSVSNSKLLLIKASACQTISTVTFFVLLNKYAHIRAICDTLSVPCHRTRARAFTFFPVFPWRVTIS